MRSVGALGRLVLAIAVLLTAGALWSAADSPSHAVAARPGPAASPASWLHHQRARTVRRLPGHTVRVGPRLAAGIARPAPRTQRPSIPPIRRALAPYAPPLAAPNDPEWALQWGLTDVDAPAAWALAGPVRPVIVAVVDSGVDPSQPDLQGALVPGADFADSTGSTADQYGHGTMVAGVIAARGNNGEGVAGACWTCFVMPIKVLGADGSGTADAITAGIRWATDHGANVINMSFILSGPDQGVEDAIAYAHEHGVLVVAAAGNSGADTPTFPASYPSVVSVAATDASGQLYPWSTHGPWVTLAAPGCTVTTALGGGFEPFCGTSAAAPLVAGLAALAYSSSGIDEAGLEAALAQTATPLPGVVASGRVDALRLVQQLVS